MNTTTVPSSTAAPAQLAGGPQPSLARLSSVELRKSLDTRSGRWFLVVVAGLAGAALTYQLASHDGGALTFDRAFGTPMTVVRQLLPVVGVLAMTNEWTQRTALTTFTLAPRRGRVLAAKLGAALVLTVVGVLLLAAMSAAATLAVGVAAGSSVQWGGAAHLVTGAAAATALSMLMGAAFGALLQTTPTALVSFLVLPSLVSVGAVALFQDGARWIDVATTLGNVARLDLTGAVGPTLTVLVVWIALPLTAGVVRALRREVH